MYTTMKPTTQFFIALILIIMGILLWRQYTSTSTGNESFEYIRVLPTDWWYNHLDRILRVSYNHGQDYEFCKDTACEKIQPVLERVLAVTDQDHVVIRCTPDPTSGECAMDISHDNPKDRSKAQKRFAPCASVVPKRLCIQLRDAVAVHYQSL